MNWTIIAAYVAVTLALSGCASVAPESARLSAGIGQQIAALKKNHLSYVSNYYDRLEEEASEAVDRLYAPAIVEAALDGQAGQQLRRSVESGGDAATIVHFLALLRTRVEKRRKADTARIADAKQAALAQTQAAYDQVLQRNDAITAYLGSLVRLRETQDAGLGLPNVAEPK